ncbi:hypothetical protein BZA05DRAFT_434701 [Tricharina praecox]|uniref:uncharacterized protein n=1 Tax=Tricharina praecox TaxID=43433 RepID=UPI002220F7F1|nr:uncharacterized protein BZA05DRAFT_434701 [Tricharina praecox]KAI5855380.1 hypothetical protein BZA05DRAFT_434701 [Tricharina praecox]
MSTHDAAQCTHIYCQLHRAMDPLDNRLPSLLPMVPPYRSASHGPAPPFQSRVRSSFSCPFSDPLFGFGNSSAASSVTLDHESSVKRKREDGEKEQEGDDEKEMDGEEGYYGGEYVSVSNRDEEWIERVEESSDNGNPKRAVLPTKPLEPVTPIRPIRQLGSAPAPKKLKSTPYRVMPDKWTDPGAKPPKSPVTYEEWTAKYWKPRKTDSKPVLIGWQARPAGQDKKKGSDSGPNRPTAKSDLPAQPENVATATLTNPANLTASDVSAIESTDLASEKLAAACSSGLECEDGSVITSGGSSSPQRESHSLGSSAIKSSPPGSTCGTLDESGNSSSDSEDSSGDSGIGSGDGDIGSSDSGISSSDSGNNSSDSEDSNRSRFPALPERWFLPAPIFPNHIYNFPFSSSGPSTGFSSSGPSTGNIDTSGSSIVDDDDCDGCSDCSRDSDSDSDCSSSYFEGDMQTIREERFSTGASYSSVASNGPSATQQPLLEDDDICGGTGCDHLTIDKPEFRRVVQNIMEEIGKGDFLWAPGALTTLQSLAEDYAVRELAVLNRICQHRNGDAIEPKDKELLDMFSMRRTGYSEDAFKKF